MISLSYEPYLNKKAWIVNDKTVIHSEIINVLSDYSIKKFFKMEFGIDVEDAFINQLRNPSADNLQMTIGEEI